MQAATPLEAVLRRDRAIVLAGVVGVAILAWVYLFYLAWDMQRGMSAGSMQTGMGLAMSQVRAWGAVDFLLMFVMWAVMMIAMMVPTAAPMTLAFATINRRRLEQQQPFVPTSVFLSGYVLVWSVFAAGAALAQWGLNTAALLSPMMASTSPFLGGGLLMAAGLITGEAMLGILLAIPLAAWQGQNRIAEWFVGMTGMEDLTWPGLVLLVLLMGLLYRVARGR